MTLQERIADFEARHCYMSINRGALAKIAAGAKAQEARITTLETEIAAWQLATGLSNNGVDGDCDGITPKHLETYLGALEIEGKL